LELPADLEALVAGARVARLATVDERGRPHVVPVCFVLNEGCVYTPLDAKPKRVALVRLRRVRNIAANPDVQLLVDRYEEDWTRLAYVQLRGRAALLEPGAPSTGSGQATHAAALALLRAKYAQYVAMPLENAPLIKVTIESVVTWRASS
jgi:PPOX class probable F420-dependent enzyme